MPQIGLAVDGDPDYYPDHLELDLLPPVGTVVDIDEQLFVVTELRLTSRRRVDGGVGRRQHWVMALAPMPEHGAPPYVLATAP
jgi:hypothetical protein